MNTHVANRPHASAGGHRSLTANHVLLVLMAVIAAAYYPTLHELHLKWMLFDQFYSHGYLLLAFALWLGFGVRHRLRVLGGAASPWFLLPLAGVVLLWTLARIVDVQIVQFMLLPALLLLACAAALGLRAALLVAGPVVLIYFAIPLWDYAIPLLQAITVAICGAFIEVLGIPARLDGYYIEIPAGVFHVEQGCSGVNYLVVMLALAYSYAWLERLNPRQWIALLALAALMGLVTNWVRVGSLVVIGYETQMQHPLVHDHVNYGWMLFVGALLLVALIGRYLIAAFASVPAETAATPARASQCKPLTVTLVIGVLLAGPALSWLAFAQLSGTTTQKPIALAHGTVINGWVFTQPETAPRWSPDFRNADEVVIRKVSNGVDQMFLHIYRYHSQAHDRELIGYHNQLATEGVWEQLGEGRSEGGLPYVELRSVQEPQTILVFYWYDVASRVATSDLHAKLYSALGLLQRRSDATLVALSYACGVRCGEPRLADVSDGFVNVIRGVLNEQVD